MGPDTYDLVSLLRDSYVDLPEQTVSELVAYFMALKGEADQEEAFSTSRARSDTFATISAVTSGSPGCATSWRRM